MWFPVGMNHWQGLAAPFMESSVDLGRALRLVILRKGQTLKWGGFLNCQALHLAGHYLTPPPPSIASHSRDDVVFRHDNRSRHNGQGLDVSHLSQGRSAIYQHHINCLDTSLSRLTKLWVGWIRYLTLILQGRNFYFAHRVQSG